MATSKTNDPRFLALDADALDDVCGGLGGPVFPNGTQGFGFDSWSPAPVETGPMAFSGETLASLNATHAPIELNATSLASARALTELTAGTLVFHDNGDAVITADDFLRGAGINEAAAAHFLGGIIDRIHDDSTLPSIVQALPNGSVFGSLAPPVDPPPATQNVPTEDPSFFDLGGA